MPPLVSVIIPSHNYGRYVREAVESVWRQELDEVEVIVVDDGSTDDTQEVLASITDPRLVTLRLPGNGTSAARNAGLDRATGKYIAFLDADDRWVPGKLRQQLELMEAEPEVAFTFSDLSRFDSQGPFRRTQFYFVPELAGIPSRPSRAGGGRVIEADTFTALIAPGQFPSWVVTCLIRHDAVRTLRYDERIGLNQDQHYMLRVYPLGKAAYHTEPFVEVRRHDRNSYTSPLPKLEADVRILTHLLEEPFQPAHHAALRRRIGRAWAALGYYHFWNRAPLKAALAYLHALRYPGIQRGDLSHLLTLPIVPFLPPRDAHWIDNRHRPANQSSDSRTKG